MPVLGAHMSIAGGYYKAVEAAKKHEMRSVQLFTKNNSQWRAAPLTGSQVNAFREAVRENNIIHTVAHNSYLINLASPVDDLWKKSIDAMTVEVERGEALGIGNLVCHPGAHVGQGEEPGLARIALGLDEVHRRTRGVALKIALETTAGQGTCLGHRFEQLGAILDRVAEPDRFGICVDTCHIFAAGYSLETFEQYNATIAELEGEIGRGRVRVWHLNDSLRECGSRVDRHAGIGRGHMGLEPFRHILNDQRFASLPMILETPKGLDAGEDLDSINLRTLQQLLAATQ